MMNNGTTSKSRRRCHVATTHQARHAAHWWEMACWRQMTAHADHGYVRRRTQGRSYVRT